MELEILMIHVCYLHWKLFTIGLEAILEKQMRDEVQKDESTCTGAKGYMNTGRLDLETLAHWSLNIVGVLCREFIEVHKVFARFLFIYGR